MWSAILVLSALLSAAADPAAGAPPRRAERAAVVRAEDPGPDRPVIPLASPDEVARLCRALEPVERVRPEGDAVERGEEEARRDAERDAAVRGRYEVRVPAAGLAFGPYAAPERRLALAGPAMVPVADGKAWLWPTEERRLAVDVDPAGARSILDAQRGGRLGLALVFDLSDDASCETGARGTGRLTLPVEPVSWRWTDGPVDLARGGAAAERPLLTAAQGARPRVAVGEPLAGGPEAARAVRARASELEACYEEALRRDPALDGVLVADLGGRQPAISADSVGDGELATCVRRVLAPLAPARGGKLTVPLRFELEPPGGAPPSRE